MSTREIALRCAAAMDRNLLRHNWPKDANKREVYGLAQRKHRPRMVAILRQLDACKSDEARRLILGLSK